MNIITDSMSFLCYLFFNYLDVLFSYTKTRENKKPFSPQKNVPISVENSICSKLLLNI